MNEKLKNTKVITKVLVLLAIVFAIFMGAGWWLMWTSFGTHKLKQPQAKEFLSKWLSVDQIEFLDLQCKKRGGIDPTYIFRFKSSNVDKIINQLALKKPEYDGLCEQFANSGSKLASWWDPQDFVKKDCVSVYGKNGYYFYLWFNGQTQTVYLLAQNA